MLQRTPTFVMSVDKGQAVMGKLVSRVLENDRDADSSSLWSVQ